ncbi:Bud-site selection protein [Hyaloraphidium curvatum]|nr:Bud-site selection protein [Hyaloraphidium curvatum]
MAGADDKATLLAKKLHHFRKLLRRAAKKARTFEAAKLVKKCKALRKDHGAAVAPGKPAGTDGETQREIAALERDMRVVKTLNVDDIGDQALHSAILGGRLEDSDLVRKAMDLESLHAKDFAAGDVERLAKRVRGNGAFVRTLKQTLADLEEIVEAVAEGKQKKKKRAESGNSKKQPGGAKEPLIAGAGANGAGSRSKRPNTGTLSGHGLEVGAEDGTDAFSVADDDMGGSESSDDSNSVLFSSDYDNEPPFEEDSAEDDEPASRTTSGREPGKARGGKAKVFDAEKPRNRMGQRARRLKWEKEFGRAANHLKAGRGRGRTSSGGVAKAGSRISGRDLAPALQRAKVAPRGAKERRDRVPDPKPAVDARANGSETHAPQKEQGLHASWEAKLRQKQKMLAAAPQGKKIVFE